MIIVIKVMKTSKEMKYKMISTIKWVGAAFLIFVLTLGLLGCGGGQGDYPPATGYRYIEIEGTVTDKDTDGLLGGATVIIEGTDWSATTEDDGNYSISDVEAGTYNITASKSGYIDQTETVTVEDDTTVGFELIELVQYDLMIGSTAGISVTTPGEGTFTYDAGSVVDLVATPVDGYRFVEWTGDVGTIADVGASATIITMSGDYSIMASSVAVYNLTISSTEGGSVTTPGEGTFAYDDETVVDLVATPVDGYRFVEWTGDVGTIADVAAAATNITMSGNYSITASFAIEATEVKVDSITYKTFGSGKHLNIIVSLVDDLGDPVTGASVSAMLYHNGEKYEEFKGTTDLDGIVTFKVHKHEPGCYYTEVTSVAAEGLKWDGVTPKNRYCYKEPIGIEEIPDQMVVLQPMLMP
jgi:hypothetical protein